MPVEEIVSEVIVRLAMDDCLELRDMVRGHAGAVISVLAAAGVPTPDGGDKDRYFEAVAIGVNDLLTMTAERGGFSDGFFFLVNQMRLGV